MLGQTEDPIRFIKRAAEERAKKVLLADCDAEAEILVDSVNVYEV